jgi:predicted naringenin-chalcone synthase
VPSAGAGIARTITTPSRHAGERLRAHPDHVPANTAAAVAAAQPRIAGLATADPEQSFSQEEVLVRLGLKGDEFAERIFARCGVQRRHLNLGEEFLARTLQGRAAQVEEELLHSAIRAVDRLEIDPAAIGCVVSASLYSLGCPTLAHRLVDHYGMHPATDKYHVVGVGCASAIPLLRLAGQSLYERPDRQALVVAAESMSSILMPARWPISDRRAAGRSSIGGPAPLADSEDARAKTVGSAIFGDGCAAALLRRDGAGSGPVIIATAVHQIGGTLGAVSLALEEDDSHLHLARELPELAGAGLGALVGDFLEANDLEAGAVDHWIVHPGGRRIIERVRDALALTDADVAVSWQALADHGNVGTPSIFYVLQSAVEQRRPRPGQHGLAVTIGPGVTVGLMLLRW